MTARKPSDPNGSSAALRQAQAVLNRITRRPAALSADAMAKRQAKRAAFERKLIERPVLSPGGIEDSAAAESFLAKVKIMQGLSLSEWACSAMVRRGLKVVPGGVVGSGAVLLVLDEEAAAQLLQALSKAEDLCEVIDASTVAVLARFGRAA
jgi:hypothetical protein